MIHVFHCVFRVVTKHAISLLSPDLLKRVGRTTSEKAMYDGYMLPKISLTLITTGMFVLSRNPFGILDAHDKITNK